MASGPKKGFQNPGAIECFVALLEELKFIAPVTGREWKMGEALDMHFPPIPDWAINGLCIAILFYALLQYKVF
jgi:hypothetical protein